MTELTGARALVRLALRRDRIRLPLWVLAVVGLLTTGVGAFEELYPTVADRLELASSAIATNPAVVALYGPAAGFETIGGIVVWRYGLFAYIVVGLLAGFIVLRHTRAEEETGRADLVSSAAVGRHARLVSALVVAAGFSLVLGAVIALAMTGLGQDTAGSWAFGLGVAGVGWFFAGVGAIAAQVVDHARTARGIVGGVFGLAFLLRAAANWSVVSNPGGGGGLEGLTWLSPLGWAQEMRPYVDDRSWVLVLPAAALVVLALAAAAISVRRDVDASMIVPRPGRPAATPRLASTWALAWRLQRGVLLGWTAYFAVFGLVLGLMLADAGDLFGDNEQLTEWMAEFGGAGAIIDTMIAVFMGVMGLAAAAYGVSAALRLRSEETDLRAEPVLGASVSRWQWVASHLVVAAVGVVVLLATTGLITGVLHGLRSGDAGEVWPVLSAALVQVPAAWILAGVTVALFGLIPRVTTALGWLALIAVVVIGMFGPLLEFPQWALDVSPFTHVPLVPTADFAAAPELWLALVAVALAAAGLAGFRRRDLA